MRSSFNVVRVFGVIVLAVFLSGATDVQAAAKFVNGLAPDWNQPYRYTGMSPNGGPGPDPAPGAPDQWNAWCAPSSGANLAGHWTDVRGVPVADIVAFPGSTVNWALGSSWQDYLADGFARPPAQVVAGPLPAAATDIGWYMDTNRGNPAGWGGYFFGNANHVGSYLKDIHAGLQSFLNTRYSVAGGISWQTGTRGIGFAAGIDPAGLPAVVHPNGGSAFAEIMSEINTNRTLILCFRYWNPVMTAHSIPQTGTNSESALGGTYYTWGTQPAPGSPNAEDEYWNSYDTALALGHAVTCVGYIPAGDGDDKGPQLGLGPTDWVIVHDNWLATQRNVIIPLNFVGAWVANTTAVPWPTCPPPPTNSPTKWIQYPDLTNGMNVLVTAPKILADDFLCTTNGPVTDVHIYGSWLYDEIGIITNFHISFHADVPAGIDQPYSHPGQELWSTNFVPGQYSYEFYTNSYEYFFDPNQNAIIGFDTQVYRYDFLIDPDLAFIQTNGTIYWLDVQVYTVNGVFGWKSAGTHCYDDGVWGDTPGPFWQELRYPPGHPLQGQSFDLAFELTTTAPTNCIPPTTLPTKWIQYPDLTNGMNVLDIAPKILGDDFRCTLTGPITDIHIWGSWLNDLVGQLSNVQVSIYSDVPANPQGIPYSHPGNLLWTTNYFLGEYTWSFWTNSAELFFNPNIDEIVGADSMVFRYNFCVDPAKAFIQTNGTIYWLVVQAVQVLPPQATFGWKSAATHCYDDAVWADTFTPVLNWHELRYPLGHPLYPQSFDLAFEITTPIPWNTWRLWYFGSTNCATCGGTADFDGDSMINTNEYLAGTNPTNSTSFLRITTINRTGGGTNIDLTWTTVGGHSYIVQTNAPPANGNYTNNFADLSAPNQVLGTGEGSLTYTDSGGGTNIPSRYYRIRLGPPVCQ